MHLFVSIARHDPLLVKASADVAGGWRKNPRGYGFFARGGIPYPGDRSIDFTMNVRVRPHGRCSHFATFPEDLRATGDLIWSGMDGFGVYAVNNGKAVVLTAVGALRDELEREGATPFYFEPVILFQGRGRLRIQMNVSLAIVPGPLPATGDIPEWDTQFFQGGLPSLGRRRP